MRVAVITPPEPILTVAQAKAHLRVEGDAEDAYIADLIAVATAWIDGPDGWLGRALGMQVLEAVLPSEWWRAERRLPLPPLVQIVSETPSEGFTTVRYRAGYADGAVPAPIRHAILLMVGHLYAHREAVAATAAKPEQLPLGVDALLAPYRVWTI